MRSPNIFAGPGRETPVHAVPIGGGEVTGLSSALASTHGGAQRAMQQSVITVLCTGSILH